MKEKNNYYELLKHPQWQKKRLKILERDNWTCQFCEETEKELQIHHKHYEYNKNPWDYEDEFLIKLCKSCHENETNEMKKYQSLFLREFKKKFRADDFRELAYFFHYFELDKNLSKNKNYRNLQRMSLAYECIQPINLIDEPTFRHFLKLITDRFMYLYQISNYENHQDAIAEAYNILVEKLGIE